MSCHVCHSAICIGAFTKEEALADFIKELVGTRRGWFSPNAKHGRTPALRFHFGGHRWRIHSNCSCEALRYMANNINTFDGWKIGGRGGKVMNIADFINVAGWFIYVENEGL